MIKKFPIKDRDGHYLIEMLNLYEESMSQRDNNDYVVDEVQMGKLKRAYEFFRRIAEDCEGVIEIVYFTFSYI